MNEIENTEIEGAEGYADVQIVDDAGRPIDEGWTEDEAGLPIFNTTSVELIESELVGLRGDEGEWKLKTWAVLTEAQERSLYGDRTLEKVCKANEIKPSTGRRWVIAYKRIRDLPEEDRATVVSMLLSGELFPSKPELAAGVKDDQNYMELMHQSADGSLTNVKLRNRIKALTGKQVDGKADEDEDSEAAEAGASVAEAEAGDYVPDAPTHFSHGDKMTRFIVGGLELAEKYEEAGGVRVMPLDTIPDELTPLTKLIRRWDDQVRRMVKEQQEQQ